MANKIQLNTEICVFYSYAMNKVIKEIEALSDISGQSFFLESQGETKEALVEYIDEMQQLKAATIQKMKAIYEMINTYVEGHKETDAMISKQIKNSVVSSK